MEITVRYFTILRNITNKRQETIRIKENTALVDALAILSKQYGDDFERFLSSGKDKKGLQLVFLLNGKDVAQLSGLRTRLHEGDTLALMFPIAGG